MGMTGPKAVFTAFFCILACVLLVFIGVFLFAQAMETDTEDLGVRIEKILDDYLLNGNASPDYAQSAVTETGVSYPLEEIPEGAYATGAYLDGEEISAGVYVVYCAGTFRASTEETATGAQGMDDLITINSFDTRG